MENVESSGGERAVDEVPEHLGAGIIEVRFQHHDRIRFPIERCRGGIRGLAEDGAESVGTSSIVTGAEAESDAFGHEVLHGPEGFGELGEERSAGGGDEFVWLVALSDGDAARAEDSQGGRSGEGIATVRATQETSAFDDRPRPDAGFAQEFESDAGTDDVDDRIDCADLVKVDLVSGEAMDLTFGPGYTFEDSHGTLPHPGGESAALDQITDGAEGLVFMRRVIVMVVVCRLVIVAHVELRAGDLGFLGTLDVEVIAVEVEFTQLGFERGEVDSQIEQGADEHIAADAAEDVQVQGLHVVVPGAARALIWLAA